MKGTTIHCDWLRRAHALLLVSALSAAVVTRVQAQGEYGRTQQDSKARMGSVSGLVRTGSGLPLAGVTVQLDALEREGRPSRKAAGRRTDVTGNDGRYAFANVHAGSYVLTFERDSLPPRVVSVTVQDRATTINMVLGPGRGDTTATNELEPVVVRAKNGAPTPVSSSHPHPWEPHVGAARPTSARRRLHDDRSHVADR